MNINLTLAPSAGFCFGVSRAVDLVERLLDEGKLVFAGTKEDCLENRVLEAVFSLRRYTFRDEGENKIFFAPK